MLLAEGISGGALKSLEGVRHRASDAQPLIQEASIDSGLQMLGHPKPKPLTTRSSISVLVGLLRAYCTAVTKIIIVLTQIMLQLVLCFVGISVSIAALEEPQRGPLEAIHLRQRSPTLVPAHVRGADSLSKYERFFGGADRNDGALFGTLLES